MIFGGGHDMVEEPPRRGKVKCGHMTFGLPWRGVGHQDVAADQVEAHDFFRVPFVFKPL